MIRNALTALHAHALDLNCLTARITGFRRHALKKQVFPATVPGTETDAVVGKVKQNERE